MEPVSSPRPPSAEEPPLRPRRSFTDRLGRWLAGRDYGRLFGGLPALCAMALLAGAAVFSSGLKPAHVEGPWRDAAGAAVERGEHAVAVTAYRALLQLRGEAQTEYRFRLARSLHALGREREAGALFRTLAPLSRPVYAPAHLFLANLLLAEPHPSPLLRGAAEQQIKHVLALRPDDAEANELMGKMFAAKGQLEEAKRHFLKAAPQREEAVMLLAATLLAQGDQKGALSYYDRARLRFRERLAQRTGEDLEATLGLSRALTALGDHKAAVAVVEPAWKLNPRPAYTTELARVCAAWALALAQDKTAYATNRLKVVEQGLQYAPTNVLLIGQLVELADAGGPAASTARTRLDQMLADADKAPIVNFCLGLAAERRGDVPGARKFYELACQRLPRWGHLLNNLAWSLAAAPEPDLPRAVEMIDRVVRAHPREPRYRDTRGHILLKVGRLREGVRELEAGLQGLPDSAKPDTFRALAQAYAALGMKDMGDSYARLASGAGQ